MKQQINSSKVYPSNNIANNIILYNLIIYFRKEFKYKY